MPTCMRKIKTLLISFLLLLPFVVKGATIQNPIGFDTLGELATALIDFALLITIPISGVLFLIAAFYYLSAGANPENVNKAKSIIVWTIVGIVIILIAGGISALIKNILQV